MFCDTAVQVPLNKRKSIPSRLWETMLGCCGKSKRCATKSDDRQTCNKSDVYLVAGFDFPMSRDTYGLLTVPQLPHDMTQNGQQEEVEEEGGGGTSSKASPDTPMATKSIARQMKSFSSLRHLKGRQPENVAATNERRAGES